MKTGTYGPSRIPSGLLDIGYLLAGLIALPWLVYRITKTGGWRTMPARFGADLGLPLSRSIWLHGSSVGEVSLLCPMIRLFERDQPNAQLVISTCTTTGLAAAKRAYPQHRVVLFPVDLSWVGHRYLRHFDPKLVVIVESELWPNFLLGAARRNVPVALLNAKMSEKSCRAYGRTRIVPYALRTVARLAVQSTEHAARFRALGVAPARIEVTGNMKYDLTDATTGDKDRRQTLRERLGYSADAIVVIGGSLHAGEHEALINAFAALPPEARAALIMVPRYPADAAHVVDLVAAKTWVAVRKTALDRGDSLAQRNDTVLVVDTVGDLGTLYGAADLAFVGGSLFFRGSNKGGHNLMEPAIHGLAVLFGPYNFSFKETVEDLLRAEAAIEVANADELRATLIQLVDDRARRKRLGRRAREVVLSGRGASERNYRLLQGLLVNRADRLQGTDLHRTMPRASGDLDIS